MRHWDMRQFGRRNLRGAGGAGGLGRVHMDGGGGGRFFDCEWDGGLFFSGKAGAGEEWLMTADDLVKTQQLGEQAPPLQI